MSKHKKYIYSNEYLGNYTQFVNEIWPVYIILQKKKLYQKILQKMQTEN